MEDSKRNDSISQENLVGEKKTKITQDYEFIKEIGTGSLSLSRRFLKGIQGQAQTIESHTLCEETEQKGSFR